ncbi:hypothetical protein [Embleya sp. NBC_00896]|uniref:terpene synthase family protein n=1 Tax=Embleya sp. NBC_00896 TaxID=2975961 RepID=UPI002F90E7D2|nr:terpene synthase family protein [Embleya sp. NBC_00896]
MARHRERWDESTAGFVREAEIRAGGAVPDLAGLLDLHSVTGGVEVFLDLMERGWHFETPAARMSNWQRANYDWHIESGRYT